MKFIHNYRITGLRNFVFVCMIFCFIVDLCHAQLDVNHVTGEINAFSDVWSLEVENLSGHNTSVLLQLELKDEGRQVYKASTNLYPLQNGLNVISSAMAIPLVEYLDESLSSDNYMLELRILDASSRDVIYSDRMRLSHNSDVNIDTENKGLDFQYSGQGRLYGQVSSMQGAGSSVPANYMRAELFPDFSINEIPIGMDVLLSTEQDGFKQSINQVAIRFDVQTFKRNMQRKLYAKVKEVEAIGDIGEVSNLTDLKDKAIAKKFPKLKEWEAQLSDPEIMQGLEQLKQLENIESILQSPEIKSAATSLATLNAKEAITNSEKLEMERLQSFISEIEKLKSKAEKLQATAKKYEQYKDLSSKITEAKKFADKGLIQDKDFLKDGLKSLDMMSKGQEILNGFQAITVGVSYPYYSKLSLNSLSVNGVHIEWNPTNFYIATTYGQSTRQTFNMTFNKPLLTLPQNTFGVKLGYGSPQSSHLHVSFIDIRDRTSDLQFGTDVTPQSNRIVGLDAELSVLNNKVTFGGEVQSSLFTRNKTLQDRDDTQEFSTSTIPVSTLFGNANNSSSYDVAWRAYTAMDIFGNNTKFKASIDRVGAEYFTLGSPILLNDLLRWKAELRQSFLSNQVTASLFARRDNNNLTPELSSVQNSTTSFGINASVNFRNMPQFMISYAPYAQSNNVVATQEEFNSDSRILNVVASYPLQVSNDIQSQTQLTFLNQDLDSNIPGIDHSLSMYGINQSITINRSSLSVSATYTPNQVIGDNIHKITTLTGSGSLQFFEKWNNTFGIQYLNSSSIENKTGYFVNSIYPVNQYLSAELRIQRNIYNTNADVSNNFKETIAWAGVSVRW